MPYIAHAVVISSGATLTIDPGAIVKFETTSSTLTVNGTLSAQGSVSQTIYLTSFKDDTVGGDTNGNGSSDAPAAGDWKYIEIGSGGVANISHAVIRYGGTDASPYLYSNIYNNGGTFTISTSTVSHSVTWGIRQASGTTTATTVTFSNQATGLYVLGGNATLASSTVTGGTSYGVNGYGGTLTLANNDFVDNTYAVYISDPDVLLSSTGNTSTSTSAAKNGIYITGTLSGDRTWAADTMAYIPDAVVISSGATLTINAGAVLKFFTTTSSFTVDGTVNAQGSSLYPVYFTSFKDDTVIGDTNGNGSSDAPAAGNWKHLGISSGGTVSLAYSVVRYSGAEAAAYIYANLYNNGGILSIATSTVSNGYTYGIRQASGTTTIEASVIRDNGTYGAYNALTSTSTFTAVRNYWDAFSGPYHAQLNPSGTGQQITSYISFDPWLGSAHYTHPYDSVDDANQEMLWKWVSGSSQTYADQLTTAIAVWNALDPINITETAGTPDVEVEETDASSEPWSGRYVYFGGGIPGLVQLNLSQIGTDPLARIQKTWTHELGHALGLDHSYWENVMFDTRTTLMTLGDQDIGDYHYLWGY